jgi:hypothetical protein
MRWLSLLEKAYCFAVRFSRYRHRQRVGVESKTQNIIYQDNPRHFYRAATVLHHSGLFLHLSSC